MYHVFNRPGKSVLNFTRKIKQAYGFGTKSQETLHRKGEGKITNFFYNNKYKTPLKIVSSIHDQYIDLKLERVLTVRYHEE